MSQIELFDKLVQDARRDDDYINATRWCKHFGYDLRNWKRFPETKARLTELSERLKISQLNPEVDTLKINHLNPEVDTLKTTHSVSNELIYTSGKGYRAVTWIHPVMAVHLASYLDPDFANFVAEIFIQYAVADPTLAADIASRQETTEGLDIINKAVQERYEFIESKIARAYYIIRDAWGDKLYYNTLSEEIELNGSPLELKLLKIRLAQELHVKVTHEDAIDIVKVLAIVNAYPLMDAAIQQKFKPTFQVFVEARNFVPTKECPSRPSPPKSS
ncbi:MAG: KilA-N domain-containing protein [Nostoc sp. EkiNYC01]|nr:KilA-N domain-containing protein [Nostoc sp. EkiNYC01]